MLVDDARHTRTTVDPSMAINQATRQEVADAAYSTNFDIGRMVAALRAKAQYQADAALRSSESSIARLKRLPKADQVRYARYISGVEPTYPPEPCKD
ncbi:hypothetical protein [Novosphingobium sp. 9U]|uniref:hypothetical protein n=1 Tax=Novosphingobium sp. 9U TaxID=2653158 RepID=UPI00135974F3|nr:hypothetical protein [Novosphingobium sp. 9U]